MYAKYTYSAGTTLANLIADFTALLTGTTNKALLSTDCDQANTEILTTYDLAGWALHDAAAGTNAIVLSAPQADVGTKYAVFDFNTSGSILQKTAEAWNATTHVGTNVTSVLQTLYSQRVNITTGGVLFISASARRIVLWSFIGASYGSSTNNRWTLIGERSRGDMPWDTLAANYPLAFSICGTQGTVQTTPQVNNGSACRVKATSSAGDMVDASVLLGIPGQGFGQTFAAASAGAKFYDENNVQGYVIYPIHLNCQTGPYLSAIDISSSSDLWFMQKLTGAPLDEIDFNGKTRVLWSNTDAGNAAGSLLVPKG